MPSPDFSSYIDLTPYDAQPSEIYASAVEYATSSMPDFSPRTGTLEDAMLQSMSYVSGFLVAAINRLPDSLMEGVLNVFGFERTEATLSSGTVVLTLLGDAGTIFAGTQFSYEETVEGQTIQYVFSSVDDVNVVDGDDEVEIDVISTSAGLIPTILSNSSMSLLSSNAIITSVVAGTITSGQDSEDDNSYFTRASTYFQSLSDGLITPRQIEAHILSSYPVITRVRALSPALVSLSDSTLYDKTGIDVNDFVGHLLVFILSTGSTFTEQESLDSIATGIAERSIPGLSVDISNPIFIKLKTNAIVEKLQGFDKAVVRDSVVTELSSRVSPSEWEFDVFDISSAILSALAIKFAEGISYVDSLGVAVKGFRTAASLSPFGEVYESASAGYTNLIIYDLPSTEFIEESFMPSRPYNGSQSIQSAVLSSPVYGEDYETPLSVPSLEIVRKGFIVVGNGTSGESVVRVNSGDFGHAERAALFQPGIKVEGVGVPEGTCIVSISPYSTEFFDLTLSKTITSSITDDELTIGSTTSLTVAALSASLDVSATSLNTTVKLYEITGVISPVSNGTYVTVELGEAHDFVVDDVVYVTGLQHQDFPAYNPFVGVQTVAEITSTTSIKFFVSYEGEIDTSFGTSGSYVFHYPNYTMSTLIFDFDINSEIDESLDITNPDYNSLVEMTHLGYLPQLASSDTTIIVSD
jgi:hypothetical protein